MRLTKSKLKQIIKEETKRLLFELDISGHAPKELPPPPEPEDEYREHKLDTINPKSTTPDWIPDWFVKTFGNLGSDTQPKGPGKVDGVTYPDAHHSGIGHRRAGYDDWAPMGMGGAGTGEGTKPQFQGATTTDPKTGERHQVRPTGDQGLEMPTVDPIDIAQDVATGGGATAAKLGVGLGVGALKGALKKGGKEAVETGLEKLGKEAVETGLEASARINAFEALKGGFDSGVVSEQGLTKWVLKRKPDATPTEIKGIMREIDTILHTPDLPLAEFEYAHPQFDAVFKKYGVKVDPSEAGGGYITALANASDVGEHIWDDAVKTAIKSGKSPGAVAAELVLSQPTVDAGGEKLARGLFHEIGHTVLLKNPKIARTFLEEYSTTMGKRVAELDKIVSPEWRKVADKLINARMGVNGQHSKEYRRIMGHVKSLSPIERKQFLNAINRTMYQNSKNMMDNAAAAGDIRNVLKTLPKNENYRMFLDISKEIKRGIGVKPRKGAYMANFEEAFAELYEKGVRKTLGARRGAGTLHAKISAKGAGPAVSKSNFSKTAEMLDAQITTEISPLIREALIKLIIEKTLNQLFKKQLKSVL